MRAGTTDREQVVAVVRSHWSAGRLTDEELEERVGKALSARTLGQLRKLVDDLPGPSAPRPPRGRRTAAYLWRTLLGFLKPVLITVGVLFAGLLVLGMILNAGEDPSTSPSPLSSRPYREPELQITKVRRGEIGRDGGMSFRLVRFRVAKSVELRADRGGGRLAPADGRQFIVAEVEGVNGNPQPADPFCGSNGAQLLTRNGRGFDQIDQSYHLAGNEKICSGGLSPDESALFQLVFEVERGLRARSVDVWNQSEEDDILGRETRLRLRA